MNKIVKDYADWVLGSVGLLLALILIWSLIWGAISISRNIARTFGSLDSVSPEAKFELDKAKQLDFRGLNR